MQTIIELERTAAAHWRGTEEQWLGDWLLRAAEGFTGRANSVLPLGDPGMPLDAALAAVTGWYRARGLPPMIAVPAALDTEPTARALDDHLSQRNWATRPGPAFVMVADLPLARLRRDSLAAGREVRVASEPGDAWAAMYHYRGQEHLPPIARKVLTSAEYQSFVSIEAGDELLAIARLSVAGGWAGITAVEVNAAYRRQGLGAAITAATCQEAARRGIARAFLQVEVTNAAARALYEHLGFQYSHRYHYRTRHAGNVRRGDTPEARDTSAGAGYSLRLGLWLPLGPGARQARGAGGRAPSAATTTTMSRPTSYSRPRRRAEARAEARAAPGRAAARSPAALAAAVPGAGRAVRRGQAALGPAVRPWPSPAPSHAAARPGGASPPAAPP